MNVASQKWHAFVEANSVNALLGRFRTELVGVGIFSLVANLLMLTPTIYMLQVFDRFLRSQSGATLIAVSLIALFFFVILAFSEWMRARVLVRAGVRFDEMLNTQVFKASFAATLDDKSRNLSEAFSDLANLRQFMTGNGIYAFFDVPWIPVYATVAYLLHPLLGVLVAVFVVMSVAVLWWSQRYHGGIDQLLLEANLKVSSFTQAKLRNAEVVEAMGMLSGLQARWHNLHRQQLEIGSQAQDRMERVQGVIKFIQYSQQSLTLAAGALLVIDGQLSPGAMIAANMLVARACQPVQLFVAGWRSSMAARLSYGRLVALLETAPQNLGALSDKPLRGHVELKGLTARADGRATPILDDVSIDFRPGELVAIIGPSGSGKSTLARCVLGLWQKFEGTILIDGIPVGEWDRGYLGSQIGYIPQDVELFDGTIADNVSRFGDRNAGKIIAATKAAGIHEMILRFPQGYDTQMGLAGSFLSGGQRQRIALARALYDDPGLLVFDEPNANLDDAGEASLLAAVQRLRQEGKLVLFISHRTSVLAIADKIMMIGEGKVVAFGKRDEVLGALRQRAAI